MKGRRIASSTDQSQPGLTKSMDVSPDWGWLQLLRLNTSPESLKDLREGVNNRTEVSNLHIERDSDDSNVSQVCWDTRR